MLGPEKYQGKWLTSFMLFLSGLAFLENEIY